MYYLKDYWPGKIHASRVSYRVTEEEINEVGRRWDPRPSRTGPAAAAEPGGVIACPAHLICIVSWLAHHVDEDVATVGGLGWNNIKMHAPVRPGDDISLKAVCLESRFSKSRTDCGVVTCRNDLYNQNGDLVFSAEVSLLVKVRPEVERSS